MEHETKQRVVGTIVLLALSLIFLPLILDGDGDYQPGIDSRVPEIPTVNIIPEPIPQRPVIEADRFPERRVVDPITVLADTPRAVDQEPTPGEQQQGEEDQQQVAEVGEQSPADEEPALDEMDLPQGWSVRLGVFSNRQNAINLESRLLNAGYRAYTRDLSGVQGSVTGVFVGPRIDRDEANRLKVRLQEEFQLSGLVVRFEVDSI